MVRHFKISACLVLLAGAWGCALPGRDEKFKHTISHTEHQQPARVVTLVEQTIRGLNLTMVSRAMTNIDGQFWVRSAMGDEFKIVVQGVKTDKTLIHIYMPSRKNLDQAKLILTEIRSRLDRSGAG